LQPGRAPQRRRVS